MTTNQTLFAPIASRHRFYYSATRFTDHHDRYLHRNSNNQNQNQTLHQRRSSDSLAGSVDTHAGER